MLAHPLRTLLEFVLSGVSVMIVAAVMPGFRVRGFFDAFLFAVVTALLNVLAWHTFLAIFSVTFSVFTLGIGILIINGLIFLVAQKVVRGVEISGCLVASIAAVLVSVVNSAILALLR
ncbi:MAG: phage holin family protein [Deltaproteobacteria bacterium]|nr:phage holin family protein [Deltaproteobacteria bacterium]